MRLVETYPPEVTAIDPLARALRDLRGGPGEAAGFIDAEDAAALRRALAAYGLAVVPATLPEVCAALAQCEAWSKMEAMVQALDQALPGWRKAEPA